MAQDFPEGAGTHVDDCDGLCRASEVEVVCARIGPSWRQAIDLHLCAECLADFAAGAPLVHGHVYAVGDDGLYREVQV